MDVLKLDGKFTKTTYTIFILSWLVGDFTGNRHDDYKYGFWILSAMLGLMPILYYFLGYKRKKDKWDTYILGNIGFMVVAFAVISICGMPFNGFHLVMWKDLYYILMPAIYVFVIINLDRSEDLNYYIDIVFWGFVINFVLIAKPSSFTPANFMSISFAESYSPWESGLADAYSICFFYYYHTKKKYKAGIAAVLNILSFKRLNLCFMVFTIFVGPLLKHKPVSKAVEWITKTALIISPLLIYAILEDSFALWFENQFGMDLNGFTMGRFNQLNLICDLEENMTGLGMTHLMLIKYDFDIHRLHCDIMRILIETTFAGLVVFVNTFVNIGKRNQKAFSLVVFYLIVMVSSTCLENTFYWLFIYLVVESMQRIGMNEEAKLHEERIANG